MKHRYRLWIDGQRLDGGGGTPRVICSPYKGEAVAESDEASAPQIERMVEASTKAFDKYRRISRYTRSRLLAAIAQGIQARRADLVSSMIKEAGKPAMLSDIEVNRAIITFTLASEEAKRWGGETVPVDIEPGGRAYLPAVVQWFPRGPVLAITPFNFPLNLVAHKVAPALAAGATVMLKPPPQAPGAASILAEIFETAAKEVSDAHEKVPLATLQVFSAPVDLITRVVKDPRVTTISFTGSERVGWHLQETGIGKRVVLELGGNAGVIVHSDANLERAAMRCAFGAFAYAGQVCISVQRILVQKSIAAKFEELFLREVAKIAVGDPTAKDTLVGPLIDSKAADRIMEWVDEAKKSGATVVAGGKREGNVIAPTVLKGVKPDQKISCEEAFGPVVLLETYDGFGDAIDLVNRSKFGLQAGVFTESVSEVREAFEGLEVGGVIIGDVPTYRADNMPYGGVKASGIDREGVKYAMEHFSERRVLVQWFGGHTIL